MDDVQNISAPLYGKAEPTTAKTTMSVREMQHLLGLGKTDSYGCFIRISLKSF